MAFIGRGNFPSMGDNISGNNNNYYDENPYYYRHYYYIHYDKTYFIMQMIVAIIILIAGALSYILTYKSTIIDPIENIKALFLNTHLIILTVFLIISFIINYLSKNKSTLIKRLIVFSIISILTMLVFFGIKVYYDSTYTKDKFEQLYTEQIIENNSSKKEITNSKFYIGINGLTIKSESDYYIDECIKLYGFFKAKTFGTLSLHLLFNMLLIFQISRASKIQKQREQISKDDTILFDEEQNIKF